MSADIDYYMTIAFIAQSVIVDCRVKSWSLCEPSAFCIFALMTRLELKSAQDLKVKTMGIGVPMAL